MALVLAPLAFANTASAASPSYNVFVGYADSLRAGAAQFPTPFGGPGVTVVGQTPAQSQLDTGAIRIVNASAVAETVNSVDVKIGGNDFNLWGSQTLPPGGQLIYDQTSAFNFDTSDVPEPGNCTPNGVIPQVTVTVNGVPTTYADSGQVLNTGGIDVANCTGGNESTQWVSIGQPPCATGAVLTETPASQTRNIGTAATVTANFQSCGTPLTGAVVNFSVTAGPNAGLTGSSIVDGSGNAPFTYSTSAVGTDTVVATVTNAAGTITSNNVAVSWIQFLHASAYGVSVNVHGGVVGVLSPAVFSQVLAPTPSVTLNTLGGFSSATSAHSFSNPYADVYNLAVQVGGNPTVPGDSAQATTGAVNIDDDIFAMKTTTTCNATPTGVTGNATVSGLRADLVTYGALGLLTAPNSSIVTLGGRLVVNEQIHNADGTLTVNALHLYTQNAVYGNTGDVIVGHVNCGINNTP